MKKTTSHFASNLKFLRERKGKTQQDVADALQMKRSKLNSYEFRVTLNPPLNILIGLSDYFKISIDALLKIDLTTLTELKLREMESTSDAYLKGKKLRVLTSTVSEANEENIELVSEKAKAGYLAGFDDPEFISGLPTFQLPDLSKERKYRMFQVSGDSMLPVPDKSFVIGEYVEDWTELKDGTLCIVVTANDGVVFKSIINALKKNKVLRLRSLNPLYDDFDVPAQDVLEIWKFIRLYTRDIPELETPIKQLSLTLQDVKSDVKKLLLRKQ